MTTPTTLPPAGLFRRLAALIYDTLIIIAIEMMAAGIVMAVVFALNAAGLLSYGEYADAADMLGKHPVLSLYLHFILRVCGYISLCSSGREQDKLLGCALGNFEFAMPKTEHQLR